MAHIPIPREGNKWHGGGKEGTVEEGHIVYFEKGRNAIYNSIKTVITVMR